MQKNFRQYSLIRELAKKHSHSSYLASPINQPERQVVLTIFAASLFRSSYERESLLQKAQRIKELQHPHLLPILDMGIEEEQPFVVREYLSLRSRLMRALSHQVYHYRLQKIRFFPIQNLQRVAVRCTLISTGEMNPSRMLWKENYSMHRTKIVCTIGPATNSEIQLERLMRAGMNVARLNFSHGTHQEHEQVIERIRAISARLGYAVAILQDLQGPKIRTGLLQAGQPVRLLDGSPITITTRDILGTAEMISTTYKQLPQDVKAGDRILLNDGLLELCVLGNSETDVFCSVIHGGILGEHKGMNLPGVAVSAPALTEKDRDDLRFGVLHGVDYVALSFVRKPEDIREVKQYIHELQLKHNGEHKKNLIPIPLIAKLEKPEAIACLDDILEVTDGVMIARGDLGVEMAPEKVPLLQKQIIARCNELGLPVITATQMLESMVTNPRPTRAEVTDVSNAVLDQTDLVMLSAETAAGAYPIEAVEMMVRIVQETEAGNRTACQPKHQQLTQARAVSHAARALSEEASVKAIVVFTRSGNSAHLISKDRPRVPILAYTPSERVRCQLALWWGVLPHCIELRGTTEELIEVVEHRLLEDKLIENGEYVVIMGGLPVARWARTNFVKLHRVKRADTQQESHKSKGLE